MKYLIWQSKSICVFFKEIFQKGGMILNDGYLINKKFIELSLIMPNENFVMCIQKVGPGRETWVLKILGGVVSTKMSI